MEKTLSARGECGAKRKLRKTAGQTLSQTRRPRANVQPNHDNFPIRQETETAMAATPNFAKAKLKSFVERVEKLEEEKKAISDDIREVYAEAKGEGFDVKALRAVIRMYQQDREERREYEALVDLYRDALGMGG